MKLKKLFADLPVELVKGSKETQITGICSNSKFVVPGNLFIAKKGKNHDGNAFIEQAVNAGAAAVLTDVFDPFIENCAMIVYSNVEEIESLLASRYYHNPTQELFVVGVTGTNGKTTISYMVRHLLENLNMSCGLIGTIEYLVGKCSYQATHTTPDTISNVKMLREMVANGCQAAVMEVTSHGIEQKRIEALTFDIGIFTNLTPDHLDYHKDLESYGEVKKRFFQQIASKKQKKDLKYPHGAILNIDDPWSEEIKSSLEVPVVTYGMGKEADIRASKLEYSMKETKFELVYQGEKQEIHLPFIGRFNVYNALAVASLGVMLGISLEKLAEVFSTFPPIEGRMEAVSINCGFDVFVDYCHTEDALKSALKAFKPLTKGKLILVFGCGGNRDQEKRIKMGAVASKWADFTVVTSDNPRKEDPQLICDQICEGFDGKGKYVVEIDRKDAIEKAIGYAKEGDTVLIAGKGHEPYQVFSHKTIEFDDRVVAKEACELLTVS
jgi:UDP-N-acetylmuramoyl-L-alanyl-D-glutamate--2,6-diaminopimelate ligase